MGRGFEVNRGVELCFGWCRSVIVRDMHNVFPFRPSTVYLFTGANLVRARILGLAPSVSWFCIIFFVAVYFVRYFIINAHLWKDWVYSLSTVEICLRNSFTLVHDTSSGPLRFSLMKKWNYKVGFILRIKEG